MWAAGVLGTQPRRSYHFTPAAFKRRQIEKKKRKRRRRRWRVMLFELGSRKLGRRGL